jgi:hypothetical protein
MAPRGHVTTWECERGATVLVVDPDGARGEVVPPASGAR